MIHFTLAPTSNHTSIYQITQEGFLIAKTDKLKPNQKHELEVSFRNNSDDVIWKKTKNKKQILQCFRRSWL